MPTFFSAPQMGGGGVITPKKAAGYQIQIVEILCRTKIWRLPSGYIKKTLHIPVEMPGFEM